MNVIPLPYLTPISPTIYADVLNALALSQLCFLMSGDTSERSDIDIYTGTPFASWSHTFTAHNKPTPDRNYWYDSLTQFCQKHIKQDKEVNANSAYPSKLAIGFLSYPQNNSLTATNPPPLAQVNAYDWYIQVNHKERSCFLVVSTTCELPQDFFDSVIRLYKDNDNNLSHLHSNTFQLTSNFTSCTEHKNYEEQFYKVKDYLSSGDVYQISLTHAFQAEYSGSTYSAYKKLFPIAQAPYSAYLQFDSQHILSFSPEEFITVDGNKLSTSPIKGTRARNSDEEKDKAIARQLQEHEKDRAENIMIVDLLRNDLGKVCKTGSVKVDKLLALESYSNVHHLVSTISGELNDDVSALDALAACFPGGSITGAPKKRAMEIIDELEETPRHVYCGAIICLDSLGTLRSNIPIRTILAQPDTADANTGKMTCWSGGGIVFDSEVDKEYQETLDKINHLIKNLN